MLARAPELSRALSFHAKTVDRSPHRRRGPRGLPRERRPRRARSRGRDLGIAVVDLREGMVDAFRLLLGRGRRDEGDPNNAPAEVATEGGRGSVLLRARLPGSRRKAVPPGGGSVLREGGELVLGRPVPGGTAGVRNGYGGGGAVRHLG